MGGDWDGGTRAADEVCPSYNWVGELENVRQ